MNPAFGEIAAVLAAARRRQATTIASAAGAFGLAAVLLVLLLGAVAVSLGARLGVRPWVLGLAGAGALAAIGLAVRAALRTAWSDAAAARTLAKDEPALRSDLLSSIELAHDRERIAERGDYSVALVDGHLARTAERTRTIDLARAIPDRWARRGALALLAVAALHLVAFAVGRGAFTKAYARVVAGDPPGALVADVEPITGDIELTYRYPAYMRREPRTASGTGGEVKAPKGTEVELRTRADREVKAAELAVDGVGADGKPAARQVPLAVTGGRDLAGKLLVDSAGTYRFRFLDGRGKPVAEGPKIPIAVEADEAPVVRITSPEREVEVDPGAVVRVQWQAEDDVGLGEIALVTKAPGRAAEKREVLRAAGGARRERGEKLLDLAPERLGEGEALTYWVEAQDGDTISGPKKSASETHVVRIYSEADHRRKLVEQVKAAQEEMIVLLADRLETFAAGAVANEQRLPLAMALDARTRKVHERLRELARQLRKDRAGSAPLSRALANVAALVREAELRLSGVRTAVASAVKMRLRPDAGIVRTMNVYDGALDRELEKGILYLEQLMDKERADELVKLARQLKDRRRELADTVEKYRRAPTEQAKQELLAQVQRMKDRVKDLLARMAELSKGFQDEHMNAEALAEMQRSKDLLGGLDEVEKKLAQGDVEGAMKALDEMASQLDQMVSGLEKTAGRPGEQNQELMKQMLAFKEELEKVRSDQKRTAEETEKIRSEYRQKLQDRLKGAEGELKRLEKLAGDAKKEVEQAQPGVGFRGEMDQDRAKEMLAGLERALAMKELGGAWETAQQAAASTDRLLQSLEEDRIAAESPYSKPGDAEKVRDATEHVRRAAPKAREVRDQLGKLFPDPRQMLGQESQKKLEGLSRKQAELERRAGGLQQQLSQLMQQAPIFPPDAQSQLGESRGHMGRASAELGMKNPQRGHGEQELAMDALDRFQKGLEEVAKNAQKGGSGGQGFPFPFASSGPGSDEGEGNELSHSRVEIPGADAHKVPEEFRKDLLEAMKQGAPERYRADVQRYYEELVK
ncbi:MAG: DUF4175 family protein [Anaeromyxobacter sp.]